MARKVICRGDLRHRITIQREVLTEDLGAGSDIAWAKVATVSAKIEPLKGFERLKAMQLETPVSHKITMRYRSGVTAANRILFGTRAMNIRSVIDIDERNRWLEIMADEGVAT